VKNIEKHWRSFRENVIPHDAPEIQVTESKRAFYAGAIVMFCKMQCVVGMGPDEAGVGRLEALQKEFVEYARDLMDGKA
jgi:hypothetical protein